MTIKQVELIRKKKFVIAVFNPKYEVFIVYIAALSIDSGDEVYPSRRAQIVHLKTDEAFFKVFSKYIDFTDVFFPKLATELLEYIRINNYAIELVDDK